MLTFVEHPIFTKQATQLFDDDAFLQLQEELASRPTLGAVIPGLNGLRKLRWAAKGKGKRGGARIIYLWIPEAQIVYLFYTYNKGDITDLSPSQKKRIAIAVTEIKTEYQP